MAFSSLAAFVLSRFAFVATHVAFAIWGPVSAACTPLDSAALWANVTSFLLVWWAPHSLLARDRVKRLLGLRGTSLDRPLFAAIAPIAWTVTIFRWEPIDTCVRFNVLTDVSLSSYVAHGVVFALASIEVLGLFYLLPHHVFGTDRHNWVNGQAPKTKHAIIYAFPYGLVRHPAAAAFLWLYWGALPSWTRNHLLLASLWTVFILVGTLWFEEGGLRSSDEFGSAYAQYAAKVNAFWPSVWSLRQLFGLADEKKKK